jgi:hypothetical protein
MRIGTPIGLLLTLTYASRYSEKYPTSPVTYSGKYPSVPTIYSEKYSTQGTTYEKKYPS